MAESKNGDDGGGGVGGVRPVEPLAPIGGAGGGGGGGGGGAGSPAPIPVLTPILVPAVAAGAGSGAGSTVFVEKMEGDNSCLFHAVLTALPNASSLNGRRDRVMDLRRAVGAMVISNRLTAVALEREPAEYQRWIESYDSWAGGIEISLLANHLRTEFVVLDIRQKQAMIIATARSERRVYLWYNGAHYNLFAVRLPAAAANSSSLVGDEVIRVFKLNDLENERLIFAEHQRIVAATASADQNANLPPPKDVNKRDSSDLLSELTALKAKRDQSAGAEREQYDIHAGIIKHQLIMRGHKFESGADDKGSSMNDSLAFDDADGPTQRVRITDANRRMTHPDDQMMEEAVERALQSPQDLDLRHLYAVPTSTSRSEDLLLAKLCIDRFLAANRNIFPPNLVALIAPASIFFGSEKVGKSSTVCCTVGRPLLLSQTALATRAPTKLSVMHSDELEREALGIPIDKIDFIANVNADRLEAGLEPAEAALRLSALMNQIAKIPSVKLRSDPCELRLFTSDPALPMMCVDLPGVPGVGTDEGPEFVAGVTKMTDDFLSKYVYPPDSASWGFFVQRSDSWKNNANYRLKDDHCPRIAYVITNCDKWSVDSLRETMSQQVTEQLGDELLLDTLTGGLFHRSNNPDLKVFLVCNPGTALNRTFAPGDNSGRGYLEAIAAINHEIEKGEELRDATGAVVQEESATRKFTKTLDTLRKTRGYNTNGPAWEKIQNMIGLKTLREFVYEKAVAGAQKELKFVCDFMNRLQARRREESKRINEELKSLGASGRKPRAVIASLLATARSLFHYLFTGENLPQMSDLGPNNIAHLPDRKVWAKFLLEKRSVALRDEKWGAPFPPDISPAVEAKLLDFMDPKRLAASTLKVRLMRFFATFYARVALCTPKPIAQAEIAAFPSAAQAVESWDYSALFERKVQEFISEHLSEHASTHVMEGVRRIISHGIETVIIALKEITVFAPYLSRRIQSTSGPDATVKGVKTTAELFKVSEGWRLLEEDVREFLSKSWSDGIVEKVQKQCKDASSSIETPIVPAVPDFVMLSASLMMPSGSKYAKEFADSRKDLQFMALNTKMVKKFLKSIRKGETPPPIGGAAAAAKGAGGSGGSGGSGGGAGGGVAQTLAAAGAAAIGAVAPALIGKAGAIAAPALNAIQNVLVQPKPQSADATFYGLTSVGSGLSDEEKREIDWEWLRTDSGKIDLLEVLTFALSRLATAETPGGARLANTIETSEIAAINHAFLRQTRTVISFFCFYGQVLFPKAYRSITLPSFLNIDLANRFWHFLREERTIMRRLAKSGASDELDNGMLSVAEARVLVPDEIHGDGSDADAGAAGTGGGGGPKPDDDDDEDEDDEHAHAVVGRGMSTNGNGSGGKSYNHYTENGGQRVLPPLPTKVVAQLIKDRYGLVSLAKRLKNEREQILFAYKKMKATLKVVESLYTCLSLQPTLLVRAVQHAKSKRQSLAIGGSPIGAAADDVYGGGPSTPRSAAASAGAVSGNASLLSAPTSLGGGTGGSGGAPPKPSVAVAVPAPSPVSVSSVRSSGSSSSKASSKTDKKKN